MKFNRWALDKIAVRQFWNLTNQETRKHHAFDLCESVCLAKIVLAALSTKTLGIFPNMLLDIFFI